MTGYAKESIQDDGISYLLEILSVNRKNLEITLFLPKDLLQFDLEIRKILSQFAQRGHVTVKLSKDLCEGLSKELMPQKEVLASLKSYWEDNAIFLGYAKESVDLEFLVNQYDKLPKTQKSNLDNFWVQLKKALLSAGEKYLSSKEKEGKELSVFFKKHLEIIQEATDMIKQRLEKEPLNHQNKLTELLKDFDIHSLEIKEKIAREVVLYLDRGDINEELERLTTHIKTFYTLMSTSKEPVGKHLDFLIQEFNREANTIASKSQTIEVTNLALKIKSEIEKIREQLQNIE